MKRLAITAILLLAVAGLATTATGVPQRNANYEVTIYNLTLDRPFSPPVIATHTDRARSRTGALLLAPAYDAGTENNSELCGFIPGPACGAHGARDTVGAEGFVHVHRGIHGVGNLTAAQYDWRNPVAKIVVRKLR